ncbi:hypothetical protein P5800_28980, partial [Bacillus paranthracis]|nr:hypothetical protein [Bacillus paranthracis]
MSLRFSFSGSFTPSSSNCFFVSFGIIGGVGIPAFAATNNPAAEQSTKTAKKDLDDATKQKVKT